MYKQKVDTEGKAMGQPANKIAGELAAELSFVATGHIMPLHTHTLPSVCVCVLVIVIYVLLS